ncbi:MAG: peptide deformylase [Chitinivibrionales bacterium]|nr:peptide deformylase [Chitinivibrionales bacterium]
MDVIVYGHPTLRKKAVPVEAFDAELQAFVEEMSVTMVEKDGVGLAAPQVDRAVRLFVIDATQGERPPLVFINPELTWFSDEKEDYEEGCLSIPEIRLNVNRPVQVTVKALDINGKPFTVEKAQGLLARAIQHEYDHLEGIMFVDRVSPVQRQLVNGKLKRMAKGQKNKKAA